MADDQPKKPANPRETHRLVNQRTTFSTPEIEQAVQEYEAIRKALKDPTVKWIIPLT
jgi:hypothetical protein